MDTVEDAKQRDSIQNFADSIQHGDSIQGFAENQSKGQQFNRGRILQP